MTAATRTVRFGLWYDFRNPAPWRRPFSQLYQELLEQMAWAERLGFESVWLSEHHFADDGYTPSPLVIAAAVAQRTGLYIGTNLLLLPLHNPIRVAEDAATVSILSRGRFALGVGLGYRELEFRAMGRSLKHRPSLLEEGIEILRRAWRGEPVNFSGKRFQVPDVRITPVPENPPPILVGGLAESAIRRAARIGDGFLSSANNTQSLYLEALRDAGKDPAEGKIYAGQWILVDADPERAWHEAGPHALYQWNEYIRWGVYGEAPLLQDPQQLLAAGYYKALDGEGAVRFLTRLLKSRPQIQDVHLWAHFPGEPVERSSRRLEYFARHVIPRVRAQLAT